MKTLFATLVPFFCFIFGYYVTHSFFHAKEIITPSIVGKSLQESVKEVSRVGLNIRFVREKSDVDLPDGIVLEQIPKPNTMIKPNQHVFVTLSKRPRGAIIPNVCGQAYKDVVACCRKASVPIEMFWLQSTYPKDFCIAQSPRHGKTVGKNRCIVYLSSGKSQLVLFPRLKGKPAADVKEFLEKEGLVVDMVHEQGFDLANCIVADQKPMAGSIVDKSKTLYVQLQVAPKEP